MNDNRIRKGFGGNYRQNTVSGKYFFNGGDGGFVRGHYVVFKNSSSVTYTDNNIINGQTEAVHQVNSRARSAARSAASSMLTISKIPQTSELVKNSSYYKLLQWLSSIQQFEEQKERAFLQAYTNMWKQRGYSFANDLDSIISVNNYDINTAINMLLLGREGIKTLQKENYTFITQTNALYRTRFSEWLTESIAQALSLKVNSNIKTGNILSKTPSEIVDEYINTLFTNLSGNKSLDSMKQDITSQLINWLKKYGLIANDTDIPFPNVPKILDQVKATLRNGLKLKRLSKTAIGRTVANIAKGLGAELLAGSLGTKAAGKTIFTGNMLGVRTNFELASGSDLTNKMSEASYITNATRTEVTDEIILFSTDINANDAVNKVLGSINFNDYSVDKLLNKLNNEVDNFEKVYAIQVNTKGYLSTKNNLGITYSNDKMGSLSGSFKNFTQRLADIQSQVSHGKQSAYYSNEFNIDKMIFLLNNTMPGGWIGTDGVDNLKDLIALMVGAWVWSDSDKEYADVMSKTNSYRKYNDTNVLHLFQQGSVFVSASSILKDVLQSFQSQYDSSIQSMDSDSLVHVAISQPSSYYGSPYNDLVNTYPLYSMENGSITSAPDNLTKRWNIVRSHAESEGKISVSFRQARVRSLLSKFETFIGEF